MKCPICQRSVSLKDPEAPFCSERCRLIDLGAWLSEQRAIPGEAPAQDQQAPDDPAEKG